MIYPVVLHKEADSDFGVSVPDLPGCVSAGRTVDEALSMIREAIELHLEGILAEGGTAPFASDIDSLRKDAAYAGGTWALVNVTPSATETQYKRIGITLPDRVLRKIDQHRKSTGESRSAFLARASSELIKGSKLTSTGKKASPYSKKFSHVSRVSIRDAKDGHFVLKDSKLQRVSSKPAKAKPR